MMYSHIFLIYSIIKPPTEKNKTKKNISNKGITPRARRMDQRIKNHIERADRIEYMENVNIAENMCIFFLKTTWKIFCDFSLVPT